MRVKNKMRVEKIVIHFIYIKNGIKAAKTIGIKSKTTYSLKVCKSFLKSIISFIYSADIYKMFNTHSDTIKAITAPVGPCDGIKVKHKIRFIIKAANSNLTLCSCKFAARNNL